MVILDHALQAAVAFLMTAIAAAPYAAGGLTHLEYVGWVRQAR